MLIPAFVQLNGATARAEDMAAIDYVRVELDAYDVLLAEGLTSETYADTGNTQDARSPVRHCFPWREAGADVARVKASLLARAAELGFRRRSEAGIHLLVDGVPVWPTAASDLVCRFVVPSAATEIRSMSQAATPAEMQADSFDRRRLGLAVARLDRRPVGAAADFAVLPMDALTAEDGWHAA